MKLARVFSALTALALLGACASSEGFSSGAGAQFATSLPPPDPAASLQVTEQAYLIGPQDKLDISVFQMEDLSRQVEVDSAGNILLPLVGQIKASGMTVETLSDTIGEQLLARQYVRDPQVSVLVTESSNQKVTVDGAVVQPGVYPISGATTLLQAVALARGPDPRAANPREVAIFRNSGNQRLAAVFDLTAIRSGQAEDPRVYPNDVIVVETSGARSFLRDFGGIIPFINVFRPY
jgi:polysaccharide export outer membrane protein